MTPNQNNNLCLGKLILISISVYVYTIYTTTYTIIINLQQLPRMGYCLDHPFTIITV